mmetsp:Transcript_63840/g.101165  ORF Transcript_63840/g.101165 Transcript_63840/m.101165 type:complete len:307 (-) Transcript_63840:366-1286(-)|eukprot:CAMPEP_0169082326 /NCGR_PEP_ID=MMETSP1015-20121227/11486_1 /TAXON_ID=342587 /ORGANISM="Karlodinium micrum, Strain CCMP2283" /LENGTH=306 /DNA_ID=CAMNT_0009142177 /DNA_START=59 /DNA_END=979 /DNA_ORIENTATION=-
MHSSSILRFARPTLARANFFGRRTPKQSVIRKLKNGDVILARRAPEASTATGTNAGLVIVPGLNLPASAYEPLMLSLQKTAATQGINLYLGCINFDWYDEAPWNPDVLHERVDGVAASFARHGFRAEQPIFHAAHSLSTTFLQDYLQGGRKTAGQILLGGCLLRKYHSPFTYRVPTLTVGAQFDGEEPIMRQAEQHLVHKDLDQTLFPFVVLEGQTHMQFASGKRPAHMKEELPPMVDDVTAHRSISDISVDFMKSRLGLPDSGLVLKKQLERTSTNLLPFLLAQDNALISHSLQGGKGPTLFYAH